MGVKIATTCLHWSQSISSSAQSTASSCHNLTASSISPPSSSSRRRNRGGGNKPLVVCRVVHGRPYRSPTLFQSTTSSSSSSSTILRTQSCEFPKSKYRNQTTLRRALSTNNAEGFSDEEFQREIKELAKRFEIWDDQNTDDAAAAAAAEDSLILSNCRDEEEEGDNINTINTTSSSSSSSNNSSCSLNEVSLKMVSNNRSFPSSKIDSVGPPWLGIRPDPPEWPGLHDMIQASIERKANSVDIPFSLRILKRKTQWQEGFREAGESACCSVKKAFSSMVFIIRELQSYALQMRQVHLYEDLQEILVRVQKEMNASFVWLFQQIFSHTPTLMVYVMILLANFTVYSMAQNTAIAGGTPTMEAYGVATEIVSMKEDRIDPIKPKYDTSVMKVTIIGGNKGGGGNNIRSVTGSGTDGEEDGRIDDGLSSFTHHEIVADELSKVTSFVNPATTETEVGKKNQGGEMMSEEERKLWNSVVEEAYRMQAVSRDETLDQETMQRFVSPIKVDIEPEDYSVYARTELLYKEAVSREPTNSTILSNYAQFLYLVNHDHDRAEEYFKRAARIEPADAEALSRYANFLWLARKDIGAAEETFIEAVEADPGNTFHAGNYAHFLWNTGGEDTCYYEPEASNEA